MSAVIGLSWHRKTTTLATEVLLPAENLAITSRIRYRRLLSNPRVLSSVFQYTVYL